MARWDEDRALVRMALGNHNPTEFMPEEERKQPTREPKFICGYCHNDWPCKSYVMAKAAKDAEPPQSNPVSTPGEGNPDPANPTIMRRRVQNF